MNSELQKLVDNWLEWDQNEGTKREIAELVKSEKYNELRSRLTGKLVFGTAGIRCRMEAGFGRLNDLTIIQISHGMARYMNDVFGKMAKLSIAVGYDGRYNSKRFSELAATVFVSNGISVYMFSDVVPTPVVSFATVHFKCNAGLMITASHNPKEDNGYKVYWSNGAQILAPHDTEICRIAREESQPKSIYWKTEQLQETPLFHSADSSLEFYYESESRMCYFRDVNAASPLKFTYSAFHGVGSKFTSELLHRYGVPSMNVFHVEEQDRPNPDFPTVPFPNPEEGHRVLELCIKTADRTNSSVILANDPDADRIQLAERQKDGRWRIFTGNEMGTILTWWIWKNWRKANSNADFSKVYILNSAVSSQIVKTIADKEGFLNRTTLTGFKWMGNVADEIRATGNTVILAWEESIGFMAGSTLDKDGVSTAAIFAEVANYLYVEENGAKLSDQLFKIYQEYGFHLVRSSYWIVPAASITKQVFADLRKDLQYPTSIGGDPIKSVRDLTTGYDNAQPDNKAILPISSSSEMVTFFLESGSVATLRASGTEPKIKYYIELKTPPGKNEKDIIDIMKTLDQLERDVVQTLLNPSHYGLFERSK